MNTKPKNPAAVLLGRLGGIKRKLSPAEARAMALKSWEKRRNQTKTKKEEK